jgi:hypothetical protein
MTRELLIGLCFAVACDRVAPTPDPVAAEALCWGTSGAWVDGACDCVQDGQSRDHVFDPQVGCRAP